MEFDCVIIGGGAAGLSAALVLGRARRRVLVLDAGQQSNRAAHGIGGLLGFDGRPPAELYAAGRAELAAYPSVQVRDGTVADAVAVDGGFVVYPAGGVEVSTRTVLLATGMDYRPVELAGAAELWGDSVFHCPFCHGWEVRDRPLAVCANGDRAVHASLLLRGWSDDVLLLTNGPAELDAAQRELLSAAKVSVDDRVIASLDGADGRLAAVVFTDGDRLPREGMLVAATLHQRSPLAQRLGVEFADPGPVVMDAVKTDPFCRTSVPGVFAAGDVSAQMPQVAAAVAAGSMAGAAIMQTLMSEDVGLPIPQQRS
ncbi:pyridine nucleotide-disulfide oxidoreductase [Mycobacterium sp. MS1601]|uniref:NAD(P)/FAD-dependent oxidoreductase n=1 Tax=Mycobacterium sp. MS1601 TaxID=1936029 RepID=UPI00097979ED|nr:NAD(P)/FAD-dependent oxidoreductase [Mycobacterium sp. MS1601]AQA04786.1 pyridine nucleotide-disulfide oxidoreductase [Mycobacterium sp. MS1601]